MLEGVSKERHQAILVRDALHRIIAKLSQGKTTLPSELSYFVRKSERKTTDLFQWMVCTAVTKKYQDAIKTDIAAFVLQLRSTIDQAHLSNNFSSMSRGEIHYAAKTLHAFYHGTKRGSIHASRQKCVDPDIKLCAGLSFGTELGITP